MCYDNVSMLCYDLCYDNPAIRPSTMGYGVTIVVASGCIEGASVWSEKEEERSEYGPISIGLFKCLSHITYHLSPITIELCCVPVLLLSSFSHSSPEAHTVRHEHWTWTSRFFCIYLLCSSYTSSYISSYTSANSLSPQFLFHFRKYGKETRDFNEVAGMFNGAPSHIIRPMR